MNKTFKRIIFFKIRGNILTGLIWWLAVCMLLLSLSRIGFYVFNSDMFPGVTIKELLSAFKGGFVFDLSAMVYFNSLFIIFLIVPFDIRYNKIYIGFAEGLFYVINFLLLAFNGADYIYFHFLGKRATADVFGTFSNETNLVPLFFKFMADYWQVTIYTLILTVIMVWLYRRFRPVKPCPHNRLIYFGLNILFVPLAILLSIGAARGGFRHSTRPITISNAARYVSNPQNVGIVLNTPFSILRTWGKKELTRYNFFDEQELKTLYNPHFKLAGNNTLRPLNIVIIILESFGREYIGFYNRDLQNGTYKGFAPFLDSLLNESLTFKVSVANGNKSIDAMPSILASLPSLETPYIISHYANNTINGLPSLLRQNGYYTAFFHGAPNGSMGFDAFARMAGFNDYFGKNEYPNGNDDFDGIWGLWDEPFLQFFASKLNEFPQPFMASIFTVSSHHPFKVPEKYRNTFPEGPVPICKTINYTDYALRRFFDVIRDKPWFDSTLFVITADHTNEIIFREYQTTLGHFSVPVAFYMHNSKLRGYYDRIAQQIDIMPSILAYLNFKGEFIAFGNNLFDESSESFAFNTRGSNYYLYMDDHVLEMTDNNTISLYNYVNDRYFENNLIGTIPDLQQRMERKLRAIIQDYNRRLLDNDLTVKGR